MQVLPKIERKACVCVCNRDPFMSKSVWRCDSVSRQAFTPEPRRVLHIFTTCAHNTVTRNSSVCQLGFYIYVCVCACVHVRGMCRSWAWLRLGEGEHSTGRFRSLEALSGAADRVRLWLTTLTLSTDMNRESVKNAEEEGRGPTPRVVSITSRQSGRNSPSLSPLRSVRCSFSASRYILQLIPSACSRLSPSRRIPYFFTPSSSSLCISLFSFLFFFYFFFPSLVAMATPFRWSVRLSVGRGPGVGEKKKKDESGAEERRCISVWIWRGRAWIVLSACLRAVTLRVASKTKKKNLLGGGRRVVDVISI